ncbi:DNA-binding SARP family transcriptional activator [Saccharothrix carnea]|uniref:DNA-binding SARP family transcriptional activator n=1 Tax=Saccharothrix carnea TaxID=1280637 RepID=A0A2P8ICK9_SACCR|nr:BTAD domain-containing putative transcriptional regulator [Saccharothrix carnea]PSL56208.1 DNA-binding SARP family transcriptional activator [Saccharothrix carnea]
MRVGVLGSVEAWGEDGARLPIGPPQQRCVLGVLALEAGEAVPLDRLIDCLWDDDARRDARGLVHGYVYRLRKAGLTITRSGAGYTLEADVDLHRFRGLAREGAHAEALGLWRGEPLAGVTGTDLLARFRTALVEEMLAVVEAWAEHELERGRHREVVGELAARAAEHPLREKLVALAVRALHLCGQQAEALRRFDRTRGLLADELGLDPGEELRTAHEQVLRGVPVSEARASTLPFDVPDFTGRAADLEALTRPSTGTRVWAIDGMGGVGKSTLAVHAAHRLAERYPDAQLYVDLHGFTPGRAPLDPAAALATLLSSLGVPADRVPVDVDQRTSLWRTTLADRKAVVVLDNAADAEQVAPLIPGAPDCLVLVTSRRRLVDLDGATPLSLDVLPVPEAVELFTAVAGERPAGDRAAVLEVVELCGRLPLAIRMAAARLRHRPQWLAADLLDVLRTKQSRLSGLTAVFTVSYEHLEPLRRRVFRTLAVHPGEHFDAFAAAAVTDVPLPRARDLVEDLLDDHLLEQKSRGRYEFHDLVRQYALTLPEDDEVPRRRMLDYYLVVADRAADLLQPGRRKAEPPVAHVPAALPPLADNDSAMAWYTAEHRNLVVLVEHAAAHGLPSHACALSRDVGHYLVITHHVDDLLRTQEVAAGCARELGDPRLESLSLHQLALTNYMACRYRVGLEYATRNVELARGLPNEAHTVAVAGLLHHRLGAYSAALDCHRAALEIAQRDQDYRVSAICTANIGRTRLALGDADEARELLEKALVRSREIGERNEEASNLTTLGTALSRLGRHDEALAALRAGLALAEELGNVHYAVRGGIELADGLLAAGLPAEAEPHARRAIDALSGGRVLDHLAEAHNVLGAVLAASGDAEGARRHHGTALRLASQIEYRREVERAVAAS